MVPCVAAAVVSEYSHSDSDPADVGRHPVAELRGRRQVQRRQQPPSQLVHGVYNSAADPYFQQHPTRKESVDPYQRGLMPHDAHNPYGSSCGGSGSGYDGAYHHPSAPSQPSAPPPGHHPYYGTSLPNMAIPERPPYGSCAYAAGGYRPPPQSSHPPPGGYGYPAPTSSHSSYMPPPAYPTHGAPPVYGHPGYHGYGHPPPTYGVYGAPPPPPPPPSSNGRRSRSPRWGGKAGGKQGAEKKNSGSGPKRQRDASPGNQKNDAENDMDGYSAAADAAIANYRYTLEEILPRLVAQAQTQEGSRFLQVKVVRCASGDLDQDRDRIFEAALPGIAKLSADAFGNFVVHKLLTKGTAKQITTLASKLENSVYELAIDRYGSRVIQKVVELLPVDEQIGFVTLLAPRVVECIENIHATHVIQMCVKTMDHAAVRFIIDAVQDGAERIARHQYGRVIIQRLLELCPLDNLDGIVSYVLKNVAELSRDRHGNYIVQCLLACGEPDHKKQIIDTVCKDLVGFAMSKVSMNVVEKCFEVTSGGKDADVLQDERDGLFREVLGEPEDVDSPFRQLMDDKFGNFAIQCAIRHSRVPEQQAFRQRIDSVEEEMQKSTAGKHVIAALEREMARCSNGAAEPEELASRGSLLHATGECRPCAWFWKAQGCQNAKNCQHCHLCPEDTMKNRKKARKKELQGSAAIG